MLRKWRALAGWGVFVLTWNYSPLTSPISCNLGVEPLRQPQMGGVQQWTPLLNARYGNSRVCGGLVFNNRGIIERLGSFRSLLKEGTIDVSRRSAYSLALARRCEECPKKVCGDFAGQI
ncbi:hypothetical protein ETAA8_30670 [Anatilimnocola aggregata]|uniref:Uncharacterized protein n=1 Tax=Anatilimnocola aggregata TaxID=2528021 RepID=A0A517YCK6_9BACT|nr:hypothetical protein ETAA8_30670 [Anatilimnocola aggregata]